MFVRAAKWIRDEAIPEVARYQATVTREQHQDQLSYAVELAASVAEPADLALRIAEASARRSRSVARCGSSPRDDPVGCRKIDDRRVWK